MSRRSPGVRRKIGRWPRPAALPSSCSGTRPVRRPPACSPGTAPRRSRCRRCEATRRAKCRRIPRRPCAAPRWRPKRARNCACENRTARHTDGGGDRHRHAEGVRRGRRQARHQARHHARRRAIRRRQAEASDGGGIGAVERRRPAFAIKTVSEAAAALSKKEAPFGASSIRCAADHQKSSVMPVVTALILSPETTLLFASRPQTP